MLLKKKRPMVGDGYPRKDVAGFRCSLPQIEVNHARLYMKLHLWLQSDSRLEYGRSFQLRTGTLEHAGAPAILSCHVKLTPMTSREVQASFTRTTTSRPSRQQHLATCDTGSMLILCLTYQFRARTQTHASVEATHCSGPTTTILSGIIPTATKLQR